MRTIEFAFLRAKLSSQLRLHAQEGKEVLGHRHHAQPLRFTVPGHLTVAHPIKGEVPRDVLERSISLPKIEKPPHLQRSSRQIAVHLRPIRDPYQPAGL